MKLFAGFDIGIKNLAYCVIDSDEWKNKNYDTSIIKWENINLIETKECCSVYKSGSKKDKICGSPASFVKDNEYYYCGRHKPKESKSYKQKNSKSYPVTTIIKMAFEALDFEQELFKKVESIVIELQPSKNPSMKRLSNGIEAYFILRYQMIENPVLKTLKYSSAKNKLKVYKGAKMESTKKSAYDKRKQIAQLHTEEMLRGTEIIKVYEKSKKKDDLADAFLHCVGSLKN